MSKRNQDLILFFLEAKSEFDIENRMIRLYMNRFTIDENDQTEIIGVNIVLKTKELNLSNTSRYFSGFLERAREKEMRFTDLHCILPLSGHPLFILQRYHHADPMENLHLKWLLTTGQFKRPLEKCFKKSLVGNCHAFTILYGFQNRVIVSKDDRNRRYQYQNADDELKEISLETNSNGICRSINDDLEQLRQRILHHGIAHRHLVDENVNLFHYQMLDQDQIDQMKKTVENYNKNRYVRFGIREKLTVYQNDPNDNFLEFNCLRMTLYF